METKEVAYTAAMELAGTLKKVDQRQMDRLVEAISQAKRIFVSGAGRSLLMLKGFAMRLMHLGYEVYVVGEVTTPAFLPEDLLILASASGETSSLVQTAKKAREIGGDIISFTIFPESTLARLSTGVVKISAYTDKRPESETNQKGILPGGSMFEEAVLLLADSLIVELALEQKIPTDRAFEKHANLE
ncbi:6-phospho-3-hexuloisomerase [Enterococcus gilvus]|uniref:6-phospho 3-hexuloisomerase n=1 Tax=Enterococcus gilvus ATCC BAA-350 TaxID=1158614 RepID=R2XFD0_9ENTE|nr:6-phospho-3-hexuloisomerase [Enterococcus gilvus]EOI53509.1 6-phospho 3-hexuloisomerase [Enterococcus gilvus ATCC BAA-350]EOW81216.1 6-phospho 3-hexuloisomerase [Enterococcus gilvus ATCC BAA-350]OJG42825.1 6-phospho 3-hexuloisomerase [Enterococcus gilvus]